MTESINIQQVLQEGIEHHRAGELAQAEQCYRRALEVEPNHPDGLHLLGMLAEECGQHEAAIKLLERAVALSPWDASYLNTLGIAQQHAGHVDQAAATYRRAMEQSPQFLEPAMRLGSLLGSRQRHPEAAAILRSAINAHPNSADARFLLAAALEGMGLGDEAIDEYRRAVLIDPTFAPAHYNLGNALENRGLLEEAAKCYERAGQCDTKLAEAANNHGKIRQKQRRFEEAVGAYQRAIEARPNWPIPHINLAGAMHAQGRLTEAIAEYQTALTLDPSDAQTHSSLLVAMSSAADVDPKAAYDEHVAWAQRNATAPALLHFNVRDPERRLRVGYVWGGFCNHPLASFLEPILANHDRERFEIVCYSNNISDDETTQRMRSVAAEWRDIKNTFDDRAARIINDDRIDILVDLAGHAPGNRLKIFAHKPAPIAASYLGYFNTTGLSQIDYLVVGPGDVPPHAERQVAPLECPWCWTEPADAPEVAPLPMLSNGFTTFGCFTHLSRINGPLLDLWVGVLNESIASRLVIRAIGLEDVLTRNRISDGLTRRGIEPDRFDLLPPAISQRQTLDAYNQIDLALDTLPHNGLIATCQAMYMGVPVLTIAGERFASRIGRDLLHAVGLDEFIVRETDDYILEAALAGADPIE